MSMHITHAIRSFFDTWGLKFLASYQRLTGTFLSVSVADLFWSI